MKPRDRQRLLILGLGLFVLLNLPFVLIYQQGNFSFWGYPSFYFFVFLIWLLSIIFSWYITSKRNE